MLYYRCQDKYSGPGRWCGKGRELDPSVEEAFESLYREGAFERIREEIPGVTSGSEN